MKAENNDQGFVISQTYAIAELKGGDAYPVPVHEWNSLKTSVEKMSSESSFYKDFGLIFITTSIATEISILTGAYDSPTEKVNLHVAYDIVAICFIAGILCLTFASKEKKLTKLGATGIVAQMITMEARFNLKSCASSSAETTRI